MSTVRSSGVSSNSKWADYGVGVDVHSRFAAVTLIIPHYDRQSETRVQKHFSVATPDLIKAKEWIYDTVRQYNRPINQFHYTIESTACYHYPVLRAWGGCPSVVNPNLIRQGSRKTDDLDAISLSEMDLQGRWPRSYVVPDDQQALRILLRLHSRYRRFASLWMLSLGSSLLKYGITFNRKGSLGNSDVRPFVEDLLAGRELTEEAAKYIPSELPNLQLLRPLSECFEQHDRMVKLKAETWKLIKESLKTTKFSMAGRIETGGSIVERLKTIPGCGEQTATWILAETGDVARFPTSTAFTAWCGCDLSLRVSAGHVTSFQRRKGHRHLHWLLVQAASAALRSEDSLGDWGRNRIKKGGKGARQRAVGAVARRIAEGAYYVMLKNENWAPKGKKNGEKTR